MPQQIIDGIAHKRCGHCMQWQPRHQFQRATGRPDGLQPTCKPCTAAYRVANRTRKNEYARQYRDEHRAELIAKGRQAFAENPNLYREAHARSKAHRNAYSRTWLAAHPDYQRQWDQAHLERRREISRKRRALKAGTPGVNHTEQEWESLKAFYGWRCLCCKRHEGEIRLTRDHVIPLSKGGSDAIDNIQCLCLSCNDSKGVQTIDYRPYPYQPAV